MILTAETKDKYYKINGYSRLEAYNGIKENELKGIFDFTRNFNNEEELINFLIDNNFLPNYFNQSKLYIRNMSNGNLKSTKHKVIFKKDAHMYVDYLEDQIIRRINDQKFMLSLVDQYSAYYMKKRPQIYQLLLKIKRDILTYDNTTLLEEVDDFVSRVIYEIDRTTTPFTKKEKFSDKLKLAYFVINYDKKNEKLIEKEDNIEKKEKNLTTLNNSNVEYDQMNIFDYQKEINNNKKSGNDAIQIQMQIDEYERMISECDPLAEEEAIASYKGAIDRLKKELDTIALEGVYNGITKH